MAFNINQFRSEMVKDGARPNLFSVSVTFPFSTGVSSKLTFMAHATSLPPSPTQAILFPVIYRMFLATIAFYVGLQRHTHTDFAPEAASKNL
jgi:hypothetical protein